MRTHPRNLASIVLISAGLVLTACGGGAETAESTSGTEVENTGPWQLNRDESGISFITTKNASIAEIGTFAAIDGNIAEDGAAEFTIVIDSINTNNETRDPRMREFLFKTNENPYITAKAALDMPGYTDMEIGERRTTLLDYKLGMNEQTDEKQSYVMVTRLGANKVLVENKAPVIIDASDFGLEPGVEKLRELAGLESITPVVPVTFSLVFER